MPLYEYVCEQDGEVLELLRPMAEADAPVPDPENRGRTFVRRQSTFASPGGQSAAAASALPMHSCGRCGKPGGGCGG